MIHDDPDDDGPDGAEITALRGSSDDQTVNVGIDYGPEMASDGVSGAFLDTDRNPATGLPVGPEFGFPAIDVGADFLAYFFLDDVEDGFLFVQFYVVTSDSAPEAGHATISPFTDAPWRSLSPDHGITQPGATRTIRLTFDPHGLAKGVYEAAVSIVSESPKPPLLRVPVELTVT